MRIYLLDGAAAGLILALLIIFMLAAIVLKGLTLLLLKYNKAGRAFLDSFVVNIASLAFGFLLLTTRFGLEFTSNDYLDFFLIFVITVVVEFIVLYLMNRQKPVKKTLVAAIVINLVSYSLLIIFKFFITS